MALAPDTRSRRPAHGHDGRRIQSLCSLCEMELCDWIRRNNMALVGSSVEPRGIHTVQSNMPLWVNSHNRQQKRNSIGNHAVVFDLLLSVLLLYKVNRLSTRMQSLKWVQILYESYSAIVTELGDSITLWPHSRKFEYLFVSITENKWKSSYEFTFKWDCFSTKVYHDFHFRWQF